MGDKALHRSVAQLIPFDQNGCFSTPSSRTSPSSLSSLIPLDDELAYIKRKPQMKQSGSPGAKESVIVVGRQALVIEGSGKCNSKIFTDLPIKHRNPDFHLFMERLQQKLVTIESLFYVPPHGEETRRGGHGGVIVGLSLIHI